MSYRLFKHISVNDNIMLGEMCMELNYEAIGKRIKRARKSQNLTQNQLAERVDVCAAHISNIEQGRKPVSLTTLIKICNALNITADCLLLDNYSKADMMSQEKLLEQLQIKNEKRFSLTLKIAETVEQWWDENEE